VNGCGQSPDEGGLDDALSPSDGFRQFTHDAERRPSKKGACLEVSTDTVLDADVGCIEVKADSVTIDLNGFSTGVIEPVPAGLVGDNVEIRNGTVLGPIILGDGTVLDALTVRDVSSFVLFVVQLGEGSLIKNSRFERNQIAVDLYWGDRIEVRGCRFVDNLIGINVASDNDSRIIQNHFEQNGRGVNIWDEDFFGSSNTEIHRNSFRRNDVGVRLDARDEANGTRITENVFHHNSSSGIAISLGCETSASPTCGGRGTIVQSNLFLRNGDDPRIFGRSLADDGLTVVGIDELGTSDGVTVTGNTAIRNADLGIDAPGVVDGGANLAKQNGNELQCVGVRCGPGRASR
jgi:hypothetical protein